MPNILETLKQHSTEIPDKRLYTFLDGYGHIVESYTYRQFDERTTALSNGLRESRVIGCGDKVLLIYPPGLEFIVAFFACVKVGAIPVPVAPPDSTGLVGGLQKLGHIANDAGATLALSDTRYRQQLDILLESNPEAQQLLQQQALSWLFSDTITGTAYASDEAHPNAVNDLLFLQYTSGSTQQPRGVMVSHGNIFNNCRASLQHRPVGVSWLPHYHDMGLIGYYLFIMIAGGCSIGFSAANFLRRPSLWLETITRFRGTITSAPNFAFEYCLRPKLVSDEKLAELDLSSLVCLMNASEPVRVSTYKNFQARFGPCGLSEKAHSVFFGLAENTLSVTGGGRSALTVNTSLLERNQLRIEAPRNRHFGQSEIMSCGRPLEGVEVKIVSPDSARLLADGEIGEVWTAGKSVTAGYLNKPSYSTTHFKAGISDDESGTAYLRTGDLGFMHEGELFICGRLKDLIIVGGRNFYPADIEAVVERSSTLVRHGSVAAFACPNEEGTEGVVVLIEAKRAGQLPDLEALNHEIRKRCQIEADRLVIVPHASIRKTSSGKTARQLCRQLWESNAIPSIAERVKSIKCDTDEVLENLLARFDVEGWENATLAELGIDSLSLVDISRHLESLLSKHHGPAEKHAPNTWWDLRILQSITAGELRSFLDAIKNHDQIPDISEGMMAARLQKIHRDELKRMQEDAQLPSDISASPSDHPSAYHPEGAAEHATVLLTGATGFLGSFLLESLLRLTRFNIVVLARASDNEHALRRVETALEETGVFTAELHRAFHTRVQALTGDLSATKLGLTAQTWEHLSHNLRAIYHCAAEVDYVRPYEHLRRANVGSTADILRLASSGKAKVLHYVSTTFLFGFVARAHCLESDANPEMTGLNFGYAQSKWVAEQLVQNAKAQGLKVRIYRPSLITASKHGKYVRRDLMTRILSYMIRHGRSIDSANQISLIPVDVCANNIVALSLDSGDAAPVVHITSAHYFTLQDVCKIIGERYGYTFEFSSLENYMRYMNAHCPADDAMFPLLAFFNENWRRIEAMRDKRYVNTQYRNACAQSSLCIAEPSLADTVGQIVAFLQAEKLIPQRSAPEEKAR